MTIKLDGNLQFSNKALNGNLRISEKTLNGNVGSSSQIISAKWGRIKGNIENQEDLIDKLDDKYDEENFRPVTNSEIEAMFR